MDQQNLAPFIWNIADLLLGRFRPSEYGRIILPFTVLRRLECVLEPTREQVLSSYTAMKDMGLNLDLILTNAADVPFYNTSEYTLATVGSTSTRANLQDYIARFSANARQIFEHFAFDEWLVKLENANLLYLVTQKFAEIDLHPNEISNHEMGLVFEHLIRKFAESSNDDAGQFFTPRDVVRLATSLVFSDHERLKGDGKVLEVYDCAAGTGGFLSAAIEQVEEWSKQHGGIPVSLKPYAQELNPETYAISVADKLIKGYDTQNIKLGNTLSHDKLPFDKFDYCLANPPFGVKWENVQSAVQKEHDNEGYAGRFGPGLPRIGDGSLLFLLHLLSKRKPVAAGGTRIGIVLSGSPLFNGGAGSGESEIRRWILENDWLEAIVALPNDLFYNTGIGTYIWILSNHKEARRKDKVQLIDASALYAAMGKSLGNKRKYVTDEQIAEIVALHKDFTPSPTTKIFDTADFGYRRITVERPLRLRVCLDKSRIHSLRHLPDVQSYMQWMEQRFGLDCHKGLAEREIAEHIHASLGLDASTHKDERKKLEKEAAGIIKKLLDAKAWARRIQLSEAVCRFWGEAGQSDWDDYNEFEQALRQFTGSVGSLPALTLTAADIKHLRLWLTEKDQGCAPVIAEQGSKAPSINGGGLGCNAVELSNPPLEKRGLGGISGEMNKHQALKIPLNPPFTKGEAVNSTAFGQQTLFGYFPAEDGKILVYEADPDLREFENVPLKQDIGDYFTAKVQPHVADAWIDAAKRDAKDKGIGIVGYEINFNRYFYQYQPPRPLAAIDADLKAVEAEIAALLGEVTA